MTTPLKALIQERLRAKIVRQEVDGDDMDDSLGMDTHHHHHHQSRQHDLSSMSQRHKGHQHNRNHQHHQNQPQQQQSEHYSTNQKLIDYYTYEHHQKFDGYFRQDRSFGRGFHDERYKTHCYPDDDEEEDSRSPLPSPWRGQSTPSNQFHDQDPEEEEEEETHEEERGDDKEEQQQAKSIVGGVESPRYAPLPPPPSSQQQQQQQQHRSASAELKHVRDRDARVHPVDLHGFRNVRESHQEPESQQQLASLAYDNANDCAREQHVYPRGHFESQLDDDDVRHDSQHDDGVEPTESHRKVRHHQRHHRKHGHHHHHKEQRHHHQHRQDTHPSSTFAAFDSESPRHVLPRKRGFDTFEDPYDVANDDPVGHVEPHERLARLQHYEDTIDTGDNTKNSNLPHNTEKHESELSYNSHHDQRHHFNRDRFRNSAFYVDSLVTSPLAAASSLAPLVFAAATSPRLETKRAGSSIGRQQQKNNMEMGVVSSTSLSTSYGSLGALPAPLDMAMVETTRRHRDDFDAMPHASSNHSSINNCHSSTNLNRRSSSTLLRHLDAMLSPGCHRAATAFVEKRRRRAANSTPRTMATQRWLQSLDPQFRERAAAADTSATCQDDGLQYLDQHHQYQFQETPVVLPASFSAARSASSCSNRSSSSLASSCASLV